MVFDHKIPKDEILFICNPEPKGGEFAPPRKNLTKSGSE